jgi:hypothetical protein
VFGRNWIRNLGPEPGHRNYPYAIFLKEINAKSIVQKPCHSNLLFNAHIFQMFQKHLPQKVGKTNFFYTVGKNPDV